MKDETLQRPERIREGETVYRDRNQTITRVVAEFAGFNKEYFVSDHGERAGVVVARRGEVLLARQYRLLPNTIAFEIPGGRVELGESPEVCAARECLEETGVECSGLTPLIAYQPSLDIWKNYSRIFTTETCRIVDQELAGQQAWVPLKRCMGMIFEGVICDSFSIIGIMAYSIRGVGNVETISLVSHEDQSRRSL